MKNEKNRPFFKEKVKFDSHSIKRAFDDEKQDLAIFHAKIDKSVKPSSYFINKNVINVQHTLITPNISLHFMQSLHRADIDPFVAQYLATDTPPYHRRT